MLDSVHLFVVFPTAFYLATGYAESLLLLLTLASYIAMRRERWLLAGLFAELATLTRPTGVALLAALFITIAMSVIRERCGGKRLRIVEGARMLMALVMLPTVLADFLLYLYTVFGSFSTITHAQAAWGRNLTNPFLDFLCDGGRCRQCLHCSSSCSVG